MAGRLYRGAAAVVLIAAAALVGGCGGGDSAAPAVIAGTWSGSLSISYDGGSTDSGTLKATLDQESDYVSGTATWTPVGTTQSLTGSVDGSAVALRLHFRCSGEPEAAELTGSFSGETLTITGGSGVGCRNEGGGLTVTGASGTLERTSDNAPL